MDDPDTLAARETCRDAVAYVDDFARQFAAAGGGGAVDEFEAMFAVAPRRFAAEAGACAVAVDKLGATCPQAVLSAESDRLRALYDALYDAARAFAEDRPTEEVNGKIRTYEAALAEWVDWLALSSAFWNGDQLPRRERTCLVREREEAAAIRAQLLRLAVTAPEERLESELETVRIRIEQAPAELTRCELAGEAEAVDARLLRDTFAVYGGLLEALQAGDDAAVREALGREQQLAERAARCRAEHAAGEVSEDCAP